MNYRAYLESLPKKRMGAGCLFLNTVGEILILKPVYKDTWLIPGGVVEADESPLQACTREIKEEIGIECQPQKLLCIDYVSAKGKYGESLQFVFFGGVISQEKIRLDESEITAYQFLPIAKALSLLSTHSQRRIARCWKYLDSDLTLYLEDQEIV